MSRVFHAQDIDLKTSPEGQGDKRQPIFFLLHSWDIHYSEKDGAI